MEVLWIGTGDNMHVWADFYVLLLVCEHYFHTDRNGSHTTIHGVCMVDLKFPSGKTVRLKNVQHVPMINIFLQRMSRRL